MKRLALAALTVASALGVQTAYAAATYTLSGSSSACTSAPTTSSDACWGNTLSYSASGTTVTVTAKAYSNTAGAPTNNASATLQTAYLAQYTGGLGVYNRDYAASTDGNSTADTDGSETISPEHAVDNNQRYDSVLLTFSKAVALSSVTLGWAQYDSDISLWAYIGATPSALDGVTYASLMNTPSGLITNSWVLVGNYADIGLADAAVNASGLSSTAWLIGAYNPGGTAASCVGANSTAKDGLDCGDDYVKLLKVAATPSTTTTTTEVPEPGSIALVGMALAGVAVSRRRTK